MNHVSMPGCSPNQCIYNILFYALDEMIIMSKVLVMVMVMVKEIHKEFLTQLKNDKLMLIL